MLDPIPHTHLLHKALRERVLPLSVNHAQTLRHVREELVHPRVAVARFDDHVTHVDLRLTLPSLPHLLNLAQIQLQQLVRALLESQRRRDHQINLLLILPKHLHSAVRVGPILVGLVFDQHLCHQLRQPRLLFSFVASSSFSSSSSSSASSSSLPL